MSSSTSFFCYVKRRQETEWVISFCQEENTEYGGTKNVGEVGILLE